MGPQTSELVGLSSTRAEVVVGRETEVGRSREVSHGTAERWLRLGFDCGNASGYPGPTPPWFTGSREAVGHLCLAGVAPFCLEP